MLLDLNSATSHIGKENQHESPMICFPVPALSTKEP